MLNANVKAQCNLFGILKNIEYLAEHDVVSKELLKDTASTSGVRGAVHALFQHCNR